MKTSKLEAQSHQTMERILEEAEVLFFSRGYAATSVDDICAAAGVTKGAFYHHFKNKDAIYRGLFIRRLDAYLEAHYRVSEHADAHERFLTLARCTFASGQECSRELTGQSMIGLLTEHNSQLYQAERIHTQFLREACEAAYAEGIFPPGTKQETLMMLYACLMNGFLFKWASASENDDAQIDWDALLEQEMSLLTRKR